MGDVLIVENHSERTMDLVRILDDMGMRCRMAGSVAEGVECIARKKPKLALVADRLPDGACSQLLQVANGGFPIVILAEKMLPDRVLEAFSLGAREFLVHPVDCSALKQIVSKLWGQTRISKRCVSEHNADDTDMVVGSCPGMLEALKTAGMTARTSATVLVRGESGTGKELMAREIHRASGRTGTFVALNCAAVAEGVVESELFVHERGAFTGAVSRRAGCFEQADGGTLFLDEIGDSPPAFQAKLLRALDRVEFFRVGGQSPVRTQVRVVAATNRDIEPMVEQREFRLDLFYRLSAVTIALPPLRDRREDIPFIVRAMLGRLCSDMGIEVLGVSEKAIECLVAYRWPGNLRELQQVIHRAVLGCHRGVILPVHLKGLGNWRSGTVPQIETLDELEQAHIKRVLLATGGNQGRACELLGISRPTLRRKVRRYDLSIPKTQQVSSILT